MKTVVHRSNQYSFDNDDSEKYYLEGAVSPILINTRYKQVIWHMMTRISTYAYLTNYRQQTYTQTTTKHALYNFTYFVEYSRKNFDSQRS
jgi:hypothetical protein